MSPTTNSKFVHQGYRIICWCHQMAQERVECRLQVGVPVLVLERGSEVPQGGSAIAMWANAFRALDAIGVAAPLRAAHPLLQRCSASPAARRHANLRPQHATWPLDDWGTIKCH